MASQDKPHVLIIGAGLGGLVLAQALRKQGISFQVFEKTSDSRFQGWAIGIHSIIDDLLEHFSSDMPPINLTDIFLPLSLPAQMIFYGSNEVEPRYGVQDAGSKAVIRCNRQRLRSWLATNIHINFGSAATTLEEIPGNRVRVNFENGSSAIGDILVGADGVNSAIRQYLVQPDPVHVLPIATVVGEVVLSGKEFEKQLELGYSGYVAHDANSQDEGSGRIFVGLNSVNADGKSGNYYWSVSYIDPAASNLPHWTSYANKARRYELALEKTSHLKSEFTEIIRQTGVQGVSDIQMCLRELELQDLPTGRVTLLGDAAHCMTPFRGEGGVQAMRDALHLSKAITLIVKNTDGGNELNSVMGEYQKEMLSRGGTAVRLSRNEWTKVSQEERSSWGTRRSIIPSKKVLLSEIPWAN
ncbi:FAD-dependent urate hydroxylase [Penicillium cosmopolitanum]|uniref:FAD-dependent urate hydroxylase n=1 Tax=Penicillium cosmopolitanum TaxID=1131564 RepID=A0A9X0BC30_9EURO|nr:FAD-dependent urate hydroxylase [Penicillium cosmopolitanum]KAJ5404320.1 FAD-dependent urate hydroxylase [Penicillium cosmopolitanum]